MGWFKKRIIEVDISDAIENSFKKIKDEALVEANSLKLEVQSLKNESIVKQRVIEEQKEKLREQNEADILFMVKKIEKEILDGKKKEEISADLSYLANLQRQQMDLRNRSSLGVLGGAIGAWGH